MIKTVVIVATVLICIFGIIGFPRSVDQLKANLQHNIHLGLDLSGGSHLVLQVQVQDAAKTQADQVIEALRDETRTQNIVVGGFDRNDPQSLETTDSIQINIHGIDATKKDLVVSYLENSFGLTAREATHVADAAHAGAN